MSDLVTRLLTCRLPLALRATRGLGQLSSAGACRPARPVGGLLLRQPVRHGGHGPRKMLVRPSRYQWNHFWDDVHYYTLLGAVPLGLLSLSLYVFVGPAELTEIPEDYEPQEYEYERHPVTRFIAWFKTKFIVSDQEAYERDIAYLNEERLRVRVKQEFKRIKEQESLYGDYRGYYFVPVNPRPVNQQQKQRHLENLTGDYPHGFQSEDPRELPTELRPSDY